MTANLNEYQDFLDAVVRYADENPDEFLEHYGIKGMKWGVRQKRDSSTGRVPKPRPELVGLGPASITRKTKSGDEITITRNPPNAINKALARVSKKYVEAYNESAFMTIRDSNGKKVGDATVWKKGQEELYLNMIEIKPSARGRGYASAVLKAAEEFGKKEGLKRMTLEVPGNAPDARHIYEGMGFKAGKQISPSGDIWGGLTEMSYEFDKVRHADVLAHYGIKGMKWGVRRERDSSTGRVSKEEARAAKRETRAQKYDARAANFQKQIDDIQSVTGRNRLSQSMANQNVKELTKYRDTALKDAALKREGKLSTGQKKVVVGAAIVGSLLVANATFKAADGGEFARLAQKGKSLVEGNGGKPQWKKNEMLASDRWDADALQVLVADKINPNYGAFGTKNNCRRATFAYEMRRRGYDVKATKSTKATGQNATGLHNALSPGEKRVRPGLVGVTTKLLKDVVAKDQDKPTPFTDLTNLTAGGLSKNPIRASDEPFHSAIFKSLSSQPNGARGELGMVWKSGGGHSMAWEIVKGKPVIFDTQSGHRYDGPEALAKVGSAMKEAGFTRLDNVPLNEDFLMRWMRSND